MMTGSVTCVNTQDAAETENERMTSLSAVLSLCNESGERMIYVEMGVLANDWVLPKMQILYRCRS